jgi:hypothetical protein
MQARGLTSIHHWRSSVAVLAGVLLIANGCGGGTTGTSPGESFKLVGVTESSNQAPLPDTSMSVLSASDEELLLESQTDRNGDFSMELPSEEESLVVDVQGTKSAPLKRQLRGTSIVSTKLRQDQTGALSFRETFEVQIESESLCPLLIADGNTLYQRAAFDRETGGSCLVTFLVRTKDLGLENVQTEVRSQCEVTIQAGTAQSDSVVVDVAPLLATGCSRGEILVSMKGSSLQSAVFPIEITP